MRPWHTSRIVQICHHPHGLRAAAVTAAGALVLPLLSATDAHAATFSVWDHLAACESGGNWHAHTGNGYQGGLQFSPSTWAAHGGRAFAPRADQASRRQQIDIAERVLADQGPMAWPSCSRHIRLGDYEDDDALLTVHALRHTTLHFPSVAWPREFRHRWSRKHGRHAAHHHRRHKTHRHHKEHHKARHRHVEHGPRRAMQLCQVHEPARAHAHLDRQPS